MPDEDRHIALRRKDTESSGLLHMMERTIKRNNEVGLIVRRHESLKVITLTEAVVAMVLVTIATMY